LFQPGSDYRSWINDIDNIKNAFFLEHGFDVDGYDYWGFKHRSEYYRIGSIPETDDMAERIQKTLLNLADLQEKLGQPLSHVWTHRDDWFNVNEINNTALRNVINSLDLEDTERITAGTEIIGEAISLRDLVAFGDNELVRAAGQGTGSVIQGYIDLDGNEELTEGDIYSQNLWLQGRTLDPTATRNTERLVAYDQMSLNVNESGTFGDPNSVAGRMTYNTREGRRGYVLEYVPGGSVSVGGTPSTAAPDILQPRSGPATTTGGEPGRTVSQPGYFRWSYLDESDEVIPNTTYDLPDSGSPTALGLDRTFENLSDTFDDAQADD
jgi:hypothetical protein